MTTMTTMTQNRKIIVGDAGDTHVVTLKVVPRRLLQKVVPRLGRAAAT
jgi:hypothetical protein